MARAGASTEAVAWARALAKLTAMKFCTAFLSVALAPSIALAANPPITDGDSPAPPVAEPQPVAAPPTVTVEIMAPPPGMGPAIARAPQPRTPVAGWFTPADYPVAALAAREQGRVAMLLVVGQDGRVRQCLITRSSGSAVLDSTSCNIVRRRGRFTPAADFQGNPVDATFNVEWEWRLPG